MERTVFESAIIPTGEVLSIKLRQLKLQRWPPSSDGLQSSSDGLQPTDPQKERVLKMHLNLAQSLGFATL